MPETVPITLTTPRTRRTARWSGARAVSIATAVALIAGLAVAGGALPASAETAPAPVEVAPTTPKLVLTGTARVGGELTVTVTGLLAGDDYTLDWNAATPADTAVVTEGGVYTQLLGPDDLGKSILVALTDQTLTAQNPKAGSATVAVSSATVVEGTIAAAPVNVEVVEGDSSAAQPEAYDTLGVANSTFAGWTPAITAADASYQWSRDGVDIDGATESTYAPTNDDANHRVTVTVTVSLPGYTDASMTSAATGLVRGSYFAAGSGVTVTGTPKVGYVVTAAVVEPPAGVSYAYQWSTGGKPVAGQTKATHVVTPADYASGLAVTVFASKPSFDDEIVDYATVEGIRLGSLTVLSGTSIATTGSLGVGDTLTATPVIAGVGSTRVATTSTYQWYRSGVAIAGATKSTHVLVAADASHTLTVAQTLTSPGFETRTVTTRGRSLARLFVPKTPVITGTTSVGHALTAKVSSWGTGSKLSYRWTRDGASISGAWKTTYKLTTADRGHLVTVRITGTKSGVETAIKSGKQYRIR